VGIRLKRLPEHDLAVRYVSGTTTADDVIRFYKGLDASHGSRWLTYVDVDHDPGDGVVDIIPVDRIPEIKHVISTKTREVFGDKPLRIATVCATSAMDDVHNFWRRYASDKAQPIQVGVFHRLDAAYDWLGLPDAGRHAATRAIEELIRTGNGLSAEPDASLAMLRERS
jgi:hypothetical protein